MSCSTDFNRNAMLGASVETAYILVYRCANGGGNSVFKSAPLFLFTVIYLDCGVCSLNICSLSVGVTVS